MKKLKKSIKAIIISICAVVILAGSVVGAILANKNNSNDGGSDNSGNALACNLTDEQKLLSNKINSAVDSNLTNVSKYDYSKFYFEDNSQVDFDLVEAIYENYFTYKTVYGKTIYVRSHETDGKIYFKELFNALNFSDECEFKLVTDVNNDFAHAVYCYFETDRYYAKRIIVDINNVSIVKLFEYESNDLEKFKTQILIDNGIFLGHSYFVNIERTENSLLNLHVYNYNAELLSNDSGFASFDKREFKDNYFYYIVGNKVSFGGCADEEFKVHSFVEDDESLYNYTFSQNYAYIEKITLASIDNFNAVDGKFYEYFCVDINTGNIKQIELEEGYVKATFSSESLNGYYFVYMQKSNNLLTDFEDNGLMVYYSEKGQVVLKYLTNSIEDKVLYISNNRFITKNAIYSAEKSINPVRIKLFDEGSYIKSSYINENSLAVFDGMVYYIYDFNGNKVFDKPFTSIYSYGDGIYYSFENETLYYINANSKTIVQVNGFVNDQQHYNMMSIMYGGYYFVENDDNYSMFDYKQNLIYNNVKTFEIADKNTSYINVELNSGVKNAIILKSSVYVAEGVSVEGSSSIENYTDSSGTNWTSTGGVGDEYSWGMVTASNGKYVSAGRMAWDGSALVGSWFADSSITFEYNFGTGVVNITDKFSVSNIKKNVAEVNGSNKTHSIVLDANYDYGWPIGLADLGKFKGMETITLSDIYNTVNVYVLPSDSDFASAHNRANYVQASSNGWSYDYPGSPSGDGFTVSSQTCIGASTSGYSNAVLANTDPTWSATYTDSGDKYLADSVFYEYTYHVSRYVYAVYTPNSYTVSYDYAGGTKGSKNPTAFTYGVAGGSYDKEISNPTRIGYTFTGWSISNMSTNCTHWWGGSQQGSAASASGVKAEGGYLNLRSTSGTVTFTATWSANTYTIKFTNIVSGITVVKNSGSSSPSSSTVNNNGTITISYGAAGGTYDTGIDNPTKTGYTFTGWSISNMSTDCTHYWGGSERGKVDAAGNVTTDFGFLNLRSTSGTVTFNAHWTANTYSIKYALGGGVTVKDKEYPTSGTYDTQFKVDEPIRTGYTFTGWSLSNCGTAANHFYGSSSASTSFTGATLTNKKGPYFKNLRATSGEVTFTAVWSANSYTIAFAMNNPNSVTTDISSWDSVTVAYDANKQLTGTPTKTGYIFSHWNISGMDETSSVTGDIVTHYYGAATSSYESVTGTTLNNITLPKYFKNLHSTSGTVTFTAQWTPITWNLTYDANGGVFNSDTNNPTSATYDQSHNITTPVRHGYNFTSWSVSVNSGTATTAAATANYPNTSTNSYINETTINDATVKYTANWAAITYNISFEYNNPTKENDSTTATFASWKSIANPTRMGYLFDYWEITGTSACGHTASCACFTSDDGGQCSHYYNTSSSDTGATRFRGESLASCTATYYKNLHCTQGGTVTFKAHWIKKTYNVINAGAVYGATISTEYPKYDDVFSMTAPTSAPVGYHFNGWTITGCNNKDENTNETVTHIYGTTSSPSSTFTGTSKTVGSTVMYFKNLSSNNWTSASSTTAIVTITPVWEENTYTIAFDMNNPNRVTTDITSKSSITATYDTAYNITNPTKSGYTFEGWSLSGLTTDCLHYYGTSSSSMTSFEADPSGAYKDSATTQYVLLKSTYFKNLRSSSGTATLKANWKPVTYTITYHYIPSTFNVANYNASQLFTHINIAGNMTSTITVQVTYDTRYEAIDAKNELGEVIFALPVGLKFKLWSISATSLSSSTSVAKYNSSDVVVTALQDSIMPNEKRIYGPGKDSDGELTWKHYSSNIHLYACYDLAGINIRYYAPETAAGKNDLSKYKNVPAINKNVKYTESMNFATYASVVDGVNLMGWMISADYFSLGILTEQSVSVFDYKGGKYIAYQGSPCYWAYTNVDAYSYEDPTYFLYAVYSDDYSGSTHALNFTYCDNSSGTYGSHLSSKFYSVKGKNNTITSVKIPRIYNDGLHGWLPVEKIENESFAGYSSLTSATWFNSMREIGGQAFIDCTALATFTLNEGLHTIGYHSFDTCSALTSLSMPSTVRMIDSYAFNECISVTSLSLNEGLLTIGNYAFHGLSKVKSLTLPSTLVGKIGEYAFCYIEMPSVTIPKGVTTIGYACFYQCTKLATITFAAGTSLKKIEGSAFNRTIITTISIPNSVTQIDKNAFYLCSKLATVTLPDSLTALGEQAFYGCSELTAVTIPKGLTSINKNTFYNCAKLASITIYSGITTIGEGAFKNCSSLTTLTIPNSVTTINASALYGCSKLATLSVPFVGKTAATTTASEYIFGYIFGATSTTQASYIPSTLKKVYITNASKVDVSAFNGLTMLTHLYINKGVTSIGQNAFNGCTALVELSIPFVGVSATDTTYCYLGHFFGQTTYNATTSSVPTSLKTVHVTNATYIGVYAFHRAPVTTVYLNEGITEIKSDAFSYSKLTGITLPKSLTKIGGYAFDNATDFASVNFNDGLTSIGDYAFRKTKITTAVIPQSVTTIGTYAFENCASLATLVLFDGLTTLGNYAFASTAITSVKIPRTLTTVASRAFYNCPELASVTLHDGITEIGVGTFFITPKLTSITLPNSLTKINNFAFERSGLTSIYIPDSVTYLGYEAFDGCSSLASVRLSNSLTEIRYESFMGTAITRIEIPASVTTIGYSAFRDCTSLTDVLCYGAVQDFSIDDYAAFYGCSSLAYFYYGGDESYFIDYPMDGDYYSYNDLNDYACDFSIYYSFDHMQFTYHNSYYSFKAKGTVESNDYISIPSTYDDGIHGRLNVTVIERDAFYGQSSMYYVSLPSTITTIDAFAFYGCSSMIIANIPSNVSYIGEYAFANCSALSSLITIPKNVEYIYKSTFANCSKAGFQFASGSILKYIGEYAFYYTSASNSSSSNNYKMTIPDSVKYIGDYAFSYSYYMFKDDLKLPSGLLYLGHNSFISLNGIKRVELPRTLDSLSESVFYACSNLRVVYIPSSIKSINARNASCSPFYHAGPNYTDSPSLSIYVEGEKVPSGWGAYWNYVDSSKRANTFYNYSKMPNAYLSYLNPIAYFMLPDDEGVFKLDLPNKVGKAIGLQIDAVYYVNVRFEYMIYGTSSGNDMCVEMNGSEYPVSLKGNQTTTYQYYSRLMAPGEVMKIAFSNSNGSAIAGMYIKNLRIEPIERYGDYDFSKSGDVLTSTNAKQKSTQSGFTYYATEHCELSLGYRNYAESGCDYMVGVLNGTQVFSNYYSSSAYKSYSVVMKPGDYISVYFKKDHSVDSYDDKGYVQYFYIAKISEYYYEPVDAASVSGFSGEAMAYKNAEVAPSFDMIAQWTSISLTTVSGWEILYKWINVKSYNAKMRFVLYSSTLYTPLNEVQTQGRIVGPFITISPKSSGITDSSNLGVATSYGCFLSGKYKCSVLTLTIPNPGSYILTLNFGGLLDGQSVNFDFYCLESIGVESDVANFFDSAFTQWDNRAAQGSVTSITRTYKPNDYSAYVNDGDKMFRSSNKGINNSSSYTSYVAPDDGLITFDYYVSSETADKLYVYLNGNRILYKRGTSNNTDSYAISVVKGDVIKFLFEKDGSVHTGDDKAEITNFRFKKCAVFKSNGSGGYVSTNNGNKSSECVYVVHANLSSSGSTSLKTLYFNINSELIHDRVEIYNQAGECIYTTKNSANTSHTVSLSCSYNTSNYFLIKYIKDGTINSSSEGVTITSVS